MTAGILCGSGPAAGAHVHGLMVREAQRLGAVADTDFPTVLYHSVPVPDLDLLGRSEDPARVAAALRGGLDGLVRAGATNLAVACNTLHRHLRALPDRLLVATVDVVEETARAAGAAGMRRPVVLCSAAARRHDLYGPPLVRAGATGTRITDAEQGTVDRVVARVAAGRADADDTLALVALVAGARRRGADGVVVGCTEVSVLSADLAVLADVPLVDSAQVLAHTVLARESRRALHT